ncbi:hypothetical protein VTH06DRAFT_5765 [Thermothelomyces fergusii]
MDVPRVAAASTTSRSSESVGNVTVVMTAPSSPNTTATAPTDGLIAEPAAGTAGNAVEQRPSSSTTDRPLDATASVATGLARTVQAPESSSAPELPPQAPPAALLSDDTASRVSTALADVSPSATLTTPSSQVNPIVVASVTDTPTSSAESAKTTEAASPELAVDPVATLLLSTLESPQTRGDTPAADATGTTSPDVGSTAVPDPDDNAVRSTVAVVGGVIGGVVAISVLAFFVWWVRRRAKRKRRSTLVTPLNVVPPVGRDEKRGGGYEISRGSIGPTPMAVKVKASLGYNLKRIRDYFKNRTAPSVNLDRGTSQFIDPSTTQSRTRSRVTAAGRTAESRLKDDDGWASLSKTFNRRENDIRGESEGVPQTNKASRSQPDFLTLFSMDTGGQLDREIWQRQASIGHENPFSDANATAHASTKPAPISTADPFTDSNVIRGPAPAVPRTGASAGDPRRSHSSSSSSSSSSAYNYSASRDSTGSLRSVTTAATATQRNKFLSDPFDLERAEFLGGEGSGGSAADAAGFVDKLTTRPQSPQPQPDPLLPARARTPAESFTSRYSACSKYSSGVSGPSSAAIEGAMSWAGPGPDVGPGSAGEAVGDLC